MESTRKHPRTMREAFPKTALYGCAIEKPYKSKVEDYAIAIIIAVSLAYGLIVYLS